MMNQSQHRYRQTQGSATNCAVKTPHWCPILERSSRSLVRRQHQLHHDVHLQLHVLVNYNLTDAPVSGYVRVRQPAHVAPLPRQHLLQRYAWRDALLRPVGHGGCHPHVRHGSIEVAACAITGMRNRSDRSDQLGMTMPSPVVDLSFPVDVEAKQQGPSF